MDYTHLNLIEDLGRINELNNLQEGSSLKDIDSENSKLMKYLGYKEIEKREEQENFNLQIYEISKLLYEVSDNNKRYIKLNILFIFPIIGIFIVNYVQKNKLKKIIALIISLLNLFFSIYFFVSYNSEIGGYQFLDKLNFLNEIEVFLSMDGISAFFILLINFLIVICILIYWNLEYKVNLYLIILFIIQIYLLLIFLVLQIYEFFLYFEFMLFPMYLLILNWGSKNKKIYAAKYFFIFTFFGSLFMLMGILYLHIVYNISDFRLLNLIKFNLIEQKILFLLFFIAFAIKIPIYPFHMWLPEAHVEAPTAGSVLLAGILLKLGFYGLLRVSFSFLIEGTMYFLPLIYIMLILGIINSSLTTLRQIDLKKIIAYSSVAHMNFAILGLFSFTIEGIEGSFFLMLSHGIISSALFICIGFLYDRYKTRIIFYYGGIINLMPLFSIFFFLLIISNMSVPLSSNFVGEFLVFLSIIEDWNFIFFLSTLSIILGSIYSLWLYNRIIFGKLSKYIIKFKDLNRLEFYILFIFSLLNFIMGIYPQFILSKIETSIILYLI